jgi:bla regulator protein BlaR1
MIDQLVASVLPVASWLMFASLKSLAIVALVLLVRRLCARWLSPQMRYGLWFAVLACLAIPFGMQVQVGNAPVAKIAVPAVVVPETSATAHEQPTITIGDAAASTAASLSFESLATLAWLLGVAGFAGLVLYSVIRYRRVCAEAAEVDAATDELFQHCKQLLNIRQRVRLLETSRIASPIVVGNWRPTLLLPRDFPAQVSSEQLRLVLLHELAHVKRHDILVNWLISTVQIAHWFNPLAWYALRLMRHDMEQACDATVLRHLSSREQIAYGDTLIKLSDFTPRRPLLAQNASVIESRAQLQSRIHMIAQFQSRRAASSVLGAALIALLGVVAVTQAADAPPPQAPVQPQAQPASQPQSQSQPQTSVQPVPQSRPQPSSQPKAQAQPQPAKPAATSESKRTVNAAGLETASFQLSHANAKDLVAYIESAPGVGLLSDRASIGVGEASNTVFVRDTEGNVATIRQLIARLDVPVNQLMVEVYFVLMDTDLVRELTEAAAPDGRWAPTTVLGTGQAIRATLEAAQQAHRAEVVSAPRLLVSNRAQVSVEQGAADMKLKLKLTPTIQPDQRLMLDFDATIDKKGMALNPRVLDPVLNTPVPSIDTTQMVMQLLLESGATALVDVRAGSLKPGEGAVAGAERRLIAFVTPKVLRDPTSP